MKRNPLWDAESWRIGLFGLELREALVLLSVAHAAKEMLKGALKVSQRLLEGLRIDLTQPGGCGLLLEPGEFSRERVVGERFAGLPVMLALVVECPIPNPSARASKLKEQVFLRRGRLKAIAVGDLKRARQGTSIADRMF